MADLKINNFNECRQCGECCKTPCDLIPSDLPPLLEKFNLTLPEFFRKYLIGLIIASPKYSNEVLMMVPVRVDDGGNRTKKYLADKEYLGAKGKCIFLKENKCSIHEFKPFGGRFLQCPKVTGSVLIQLSKSQYFAYWLKNQHLFNQIFPGYSEIYDELDKIYHKKNEIFAEKGKTPEYDKLNQLQVNIFLKKLFPLFNNSEPIKGYSVFQSYWSSK